MKYLESSLWLSGALLIAVYLFGQYQTESARQRDVLAFVAEKRQAIAAMNAPALAIAPVVIGPAPVLPAPESQPIRLARAEKKPSRISDGAIAVLRIRRLAMEVPVHDGTDDAVLARGAGVVEGAARPGSGGNVAIAAHRDSFFRGLKDVVSGDLIELESHLRTDLYRVSALAVVEPDDVQVLAETRESALTLVTCYPFYFVGHAPQRYIVRAVATDLHSQSPRR